MQKNFKDLDELITLCLVPFMKSDLDIEKVILNVTFAIYNVECLNDELNQF